MKRGLPFAALMLLFLSVPLFYSLLSPVADLLPDVIILLESGVAKLCRPGRILNFKLRVTEGGRKKKKKRRRER